MVIKKLEENYFLLSLKSGDELIDSIKNWATKNNIGAASISGIGGSSEIKFASSTLKNYVEGKCDEEEMYEVSSILGNIARQYEGGEVKVHIHATWADPNHKMYSGHIMYMMTEIETDVFIRTFPGQNIVRKNDKNVPHLNLIKDSSNEILYKKEKNND